MNKYLVFILPIWVSACLNLPTLTQAAAADEQPAQPSESTGAETKKNGLLKKLKGNEPSYFVYARDNNSAFDHIEFYLSVEYPMLEGPVHRLFGLNTDLYFNYNGKYDFYLEKRYSSPVISRQQNPGAMFEYRLDQPSYGLSTIKSGYFHESNGQTIDSAADYATTENAEDFISRGWDYIPLELKFEFPEKLPGFSFYFKGRYFLPKQLFMNDKEDTIFWDRSDNSKIEDYAGLSLVISSQTLIDNRYIEGFKLAAIYRTGYSDFNLSQRYEATFRTLGLPLYIFYFSGYGNEISNYQERGYTLGVGVEFW